MEMTDIWQQASEVQRMVTLCELYFQLLLKTVQAYNWISFMPDLKFSCFEPSGLC